MSMCYRKNGQIPAIYRWFAFGVGAFLTIAATHAAGGQQSTSAAADTSLLSAILKAAISDTRGELRVDPRPLVADSELGDVQPDLIVPVSPAVLRLRTAVIRAAGLRTVDATNVGQNKDCPGGFVMSKPDSLGNPTNVHERCPKEVFYVLAIALPRPGRDALPGNEVYDRDAERAARGYWAARVIQTLLGPAGSNLKQSDYVLAKRAGTWVVIKVVALAFSE